jgi:hypothetical protein
MANRFQAGCRCCEDCSCRQMVFDLRQDWNSLVEVGRLIQPVPGTFAISRFTLVFDVSEQTGFGGGVPNTITAFRLKAFNQFLELPSAVGFVPADDFAMPGDATSWQTLFDAKVASGAGLVGSNFPVPSTPVSRYVVMFSGPWFPNMLSDAATILAEQWFQIVALRNGASPTWYSGLAPFIDWRSELLRESDGQFVTKKPLPFLPVRVELTFDHTIGHALRMSQVPEIELFTRDDEGDETSVFSWRPSVIDAPEPVGIYEKFVPVAYFDEFGNYIFQSPKRGLLNHYEGLAGSIAGRCVVPEADLARWSISQGTAGEFVHFHRIGLSIFGEPLPANQFSYAASRIGPAFTSDDWSSSIYIERDRIKLWNGVSTGDVVRIGTHANYHYIDIESLGPIYLRLKTISGKTIPALAIRSVPGQRGENENCPNDPYGTELFTPLACREVRFEGEIYPPRIHYTEETGVQGGSITNNLSSLFTGIRDQHHTLLGNDWGQEYGTTWRLTFAWDSGELIATSSPPAIDERLNTIVVEPMIAPVFWDIQRPDNSILSPPTVAVLYNLFISEFRHYSYQADQWNYRGQTEIPEFGGKPTQAEIDSIAASILNPQEPHAKFWFRRCGRYYTIDSAGELRRAEKADFSPFVPDMWVMAYIRGEISTTASAAFSVQYTTTRNVGDTTPLVVTAANVIAGPSVGVLYRRLVTAFDRKSPPEIVFTEDDFYLSLSSYDFDELAVALATSMSLSIVPHGNAGARRATVTVNRRIVSLSSLEIVVGKLEQA